MNTPLAQGTGLTKRKLRRPGVKGSKFSTTKGDNRGRPPKIVSYCPDCIYEIFGLHNTSKYDAQVMSNPEKCPQVPARDASKGRCKHGHFWLIGGMSVSSNLVKPYEEVAVG